MCELLNVHKKIRQNGGSNYFFLVFFFSFDRSFHIVRSANALEGFSGVLMKETESGVEQYFLVFLGNWKKSRWTHGIRWKARLSIAVSPANGRCETLRRHIRWFSFLRAPSIQVVRACVRALTFDARTALRDWRYFNFNVHRAYIYIHEFDTIILNLNVFLKLPGKYLCKQKSWWNSFQTNEAIH